MFEPASVFCGSAGRVWGVRMWIPWRDRGIRNMKELRTQHAGRPYRTLFAFDPRRVAILLIGGDKTGNKRWYEEFVPRADKIYAEHLKELAEEGN